MTVKDLVVINPWLLDKNKIKFHKDIIVLEKDVSFALNNNAHEYGNVPNPSKEFNAVSIVSSGSGHDYFADFNGGNDKLYGNGSIDIFEGDKGQDSYYIFVGNKKTRHYY